MIGLLKYIDIIYTLYNLYYDFFLNLTTLELKSSDIYL